MWFDFGFGDWYLILEWWTVVEKDSSGWRRVLAVFGEEICDRDGNIDRPKLGAIVFSDVTKRRQLNAITHPLIRREMMKQIFTAFFTGSFKLHNLFV